MTNAQKISAGLAAVPKVRERCAQLHPGEMWGHSRTDLPLLCDALEAAQQRIAELEEAIRERDVED